jgi:hypothetical protein
VNYIAALSSSPIKDKAFSYIRINYYCKLARKYKVEQTDGAQGEISSRTAEEVVSEERCPLPRELENDLRVIGRVEGKNFCEINTQAIAYYLGRKKLRDDCKNNLVSGQDCRCSEF